MSYARNLLSRGEEVVYQSRQHWFAIIARTWIWLVVALVGLAILIWLATNEAPFINGTIDGIVTLLALAAFLAAAGYIGFVLWDWKNQEWLITTRRVIRAEGVLNKSVSDTSLEKINDARLDQSVFGRIFGFGTLDILTAAEEALGGNSVADFPMIADPIPFKKAMFDQKQMMENPELAPPRYQRSTAPEPMQRAEPMPPRAGSDRVSVRADDAPLPASAEVAAANAQAVAPSAPAAAARSAADELGDTLERLADLRDRGLITPEEYESKKRDLLERM
ncbi:MAG TPA: PH domain-containing protein [Candidatus Limnocylindria bacterium]|nr:PH domain-containing protein [Candidatus Limnocylindria bacterium]